MVGGALAKSRAFGCVQVIGARVGTVPIALAQLSSWRHPSRIRVRVRERVWPGVSCALSDWERGALPSHEAPTPVVRSVRIERIAVAVEALERIDLRQPMLA